MTAQNDWRIPILTYHSLDRSGSVISTSPEKFREQMNFLAASSFQVLKLTEVASFIRERGSFPAKSVAITFDDGISNTYDIAFPILKDLGFSATIFLVTAYCGKQNRWYGQPAHIPTLDLLGWNQIGEMSEHGIEFGAHSATHPDLTKLSSEQLFADEIVATRELIEQRTGRKQQAFAYPYGKTCPQARKLVEKNFYAACSTDLDFATSDSDLYFLPRIDMYYFSKNDRFFSIETPSFRRFIRIRKTLRSMKKIVAGAG
jgi:peptidoglycan/xylan/chitin deacetylase (PgdA/CDA1 family)